MVKGCCTILGNSLNPKKNWVTNVRKNGNKWIPMFLEKVDKEKCIGCGLCVKVCTGRCYEMKEIKINGKKKKIAVAVNPANCLGDCSCHLICPVPGAIICKPKLVEETNLKIKNYLNDKEKFEKRKTKNAQS